MKNIKIHGLKMNLALNSSSVHPDHIVDLCSQFDETIQKLQTGDANASAANFISINEANQLLLDKPLDEHTPYQIVSFHTQLQALQISVCTNSLEEHLLHSVVLDSYWNLYMWIQQFHQNPQSALWFSQLYNHVCAILDNTANFGLPIVNISSSDYLLLQPSIICTFWCSPSDLQRNQPLYDPKRKECIEELTAQVVLY
ncbi:hypothetical protein E1B28_011862 [Marasmius oreades]|uniref:Uncharacterized protein n=1 Tax=Marasmius oreades TaxID=181124 RepID=A0A9P7RVP8_9AGAR|nr:uncharacterized protein E1B28_011862 [Marasmius oreades]KAG7090265.1 hypothetical protein E1B28_011862 [Marasmius oreades]